MGNSPFGNIKIALDTQILSYLLDNTYESLSILIKELNSYDFVEIEYSKFVVYELIGIRKLEHYLRKINRKSEEAGKIVNISSALNYRKKWNAPELEYKNCYKDVKEDVENELNLLTTDFDLVLSDGHLHRDIWKPHQDLVLSSKISKEDSMVLISSAFPDLGQSEDYLIFITNDHDFYGGYCGKETQPKEDGGDADFDIDSIFKTYSIKKPIAVNLNSIKTPLTNIPLNIIKGVNKEEDLKKFVSLFLFEHFQEKNSKYYIGKVISCECKDKTDMFCFKLDAEQLNKKIYLSVLTKDLKIINIPRAQSDFWAYGRINDYPYKPDETEESKKISIKLIDEKGTSLLTEDELNNIRVNGNLVFIHPDTEIDI
jgi:hypothetical protein